MTRLTVVAETPAKAATSCNFARKVLPPYSLFLQGVDQVVVSSICKNMCVLVRWSKNS